MRKNLKALQGWRLRVLLAGVGFLFTGCGGGGGGSSSSGSTIAPIGSSPGSRPAVPAGLVALAVSPPGALTLYGDPTTTPTLELQTIATGTWKDGSVRDMTRNAMYTAADATVVRVTGDGIVHALKTGQTTITVAVADAGGVTQKTQFAVTVDASKGLGGSSGATASTLTMYPAAAKLGDVDPANGIDQLQQFVVVASYADGTTADLTRNLPFSVVDSTSQGPTAAARITQGGLLRAMGTGTVDVIANFSSAGMQAVAHLALGAATAAPPGSTPPPSGPTPPSSSSANGSIAKVSGDAQSSPVGIAYPAPLVVLVADPKGAPIAGSTVTFTATNGALSAASATTNAMGQATVTLTPSTIGAVTVVAAATGIGQIPFNELGSPKPAGSGGYSYVNDIQPLFQTQCVKCHVTGGAAGKAPLDTYVAVTQGSTQYAHTPPKYVVPKDTVNSLIVAKITGKAGADMSAPAYGNLGSTQVALITAWVAQGAAQNPTAGATPKALILAEGNGQTGPAGSRLPVALGVYVVDANQAAVPNTSVTFAVTAGGGTLSATTVLSDGTGLAAATLVVGNTPGTNNQTVTATVTGLTPITFTESASVSNFNAGVLANSTNPLDIAIATGLKQANVSPGALSTDDEFIRRATIVLLGRIPTAAELTTFRNDKTATKRATLVDKLLADPAFGTHWSKDIFNTWITTPSTKAADIDTTIMTALNNDTPLTTIVTNLATGTGVEGTAFDAATPMAYMKSDALMLAFTGMTSKCARCHNHHLTSPQDDPMWLQNDNYSLYAFFAVTAKDATEIDVNGNPVIDPVTKQPIVRQPGWVVDGYKNAPASVGVVLTDPLATRRAKFASLLVASNAFARGTGHRIWSEVANPLLDPNQFLAANLAAVSVPNVLQSLGTEFANDKFSLKSFLREILNSKAWQLTSAGATAANDSVLARYPVARVNAEVADQAMSEVAGVTYAPSAFVLFNFGYPSTRAVIDERSNSVNMGQYFCVTNSPQAATGRIAMTGSQITALANQVTAKTITIDQAITTIFQSALSRDPSPTELATIKTIAATAPTTAQAVSDIAVGVQTSIEFTMRK